jgi:phospholipid/cholesterol/gamma-HCH transport system permease protein
MTTAPATEQIKCKISFDRPKEDTLLVHITGNCKIGEELPLAEDVQKQIESGSGIRRITFDTHDLTGWDSGLLTFLDKVIDQCSQNKIETEKEGLPEGVQRLLSLASAVPERKGARRESVRSLFLEQIGQSAMDFWSSVLEMLDFIGEASTAFMRLLRGKAQYRRSEFFMIIQDCGAQAFPIVSLISALVGLWSV